MRLTHLPWALSAGPAVFVKPSGPNVLLRSQPYGETARTSTVSALADSCGPRRGEPVVPAARAVSIAGRVNLPRRRRGSCSRRWPSAPRSGPGFPRTRFAVPAGCATHAAAVRATAAGLKLVIPETYAPRAIGRGDGPRAARRGSAGRVVVVANHRPYRACHCFRRRAADPCWGHGESARRRCITIAGVRPTCRRWRRHERRIG